MASVFKKSVTKALPHGAEIFKRQGARFARWKDAKGKTRTAKLTTGRDGSDRLVIETSTYTAKYRDGQGIIREIATGCRTKDGAMSVLNELTDRAELVRANILTVDEAAISRHQQTQLAKHTEGYVTHLRAKGNSDFYIAECERLARRLFDDCSIRNLRDINRDVVESWLTKRMDEKMSARTRNTYLNAVSKFCNWCVATGRMADNPLDRVKKADEKSDRRRQRRSMTEDELCKLLYVATWRPLAEYGRQTVQKERSQSKAKRDTWNAAPLKLDALAAAVEVARERLRTKPKRVAELQQRGRERALIYKTLVLTGLRRGELASLTLAQLRLDESPAYAELDAADEKSREGSTIPLRDDLAADLKGWLDDKLNAVRLAPAASEGHRLASLGLPPDSHLFRVPKQLVKILDRDLAVAGIAKRDDRGRTLDVHALRHSFGTLLSRGGVSPRTAQAAMRHSDIDLTMNVYTDPRLLDVHGALESLPSLPLLASSQWDKSATVTTDTDDSTNLPFAPEFAPTLRKPCISESTTDTTGALTVGHDRQPNVDVSPCSVKGKTPLSIPDNGVQEERVTRVELATFSLGS